MKNVEPSAFVLTANAWNDRSTSGVMVKIHLISGMSASWSTVMPVLRSEKTTNCATAGRLSEKSFHDLSTRVSLMLFGPSTCVSPSTVHELSQGRGLPPSPTVRSRRGRRPGSRPPPRGAATLDDGGWRPMGDW
jgi:hypothetical protein